MRAAGMNSMARLAWAGALFLVASSSVAVGQEKKDAPPPGTGSESAAPAEGSPEAVAERARNCSKWVLNGYRLGMTLEEARALRPLKAERSGNAPERPRFTAEEEGRLKGTLEFDSRGLLRSWSVAYLGADPDRIRAAMTNRFGAPVLDDRDGEEKSTRFGDAYIRLTTAWRSEACDVAAVLHVDSLLGTYGAPVPSVSLLPYLEVELETEMDAEGAEKYLD